MSREPMSGGDTDDISSVKKKQHRTKDGPLRYTVEERSRLRCDIVAADAVGPVREVGAEPFQDRTPKTKRVMKPITQDLMIDGVKRSTKVQKAQKCDPSQIGC